MIKFTDEEIKGFDDENRAAFGVVLTPSQWVVIVSLLDQAIPVFKAATNPGRAPVASEDRYAAASAAAKALVARGTIVDGLVASGILTTEASQRMGVATLVAHSRVAEAAAAKLRG